MSSSQDGSSHEKCANTQSDSGVLRVNHVIPSGHRDLGAKTIAPGSNIISLVLKLNCALVGISKLHNYKI